LRIVAPMRIKGIRIKALENTYKIWAKITMSREPLTREGKENQVFMRTLGRLRLPCETVEKGLNAARFPSFESVPINS
jgi:hypothetical protein